MSFIRNRRCRKNKNTDLAGIVEEVNEIHQILKEEYKLDYKKKDLKVWKGKWRVKMEKMVQDVIENCTHYLCGNSNIWLVKILIQNKIIYILAIRTYSSLQITLIHESKYKISSFTRNYKSKNF